MNSEILLKMSCPACGGHVRFPEAGISVTIDCPHCSQPFELADPKAINDWMQKQKWPLGKNAVQKVSEAKLNEMRMVGIKFVGILGSNSPDDCAACLALKNQKFEIESVPVLPLPECDKKFCKCIHIAVG